MPLSINFLLHLLCRYHAAVAREERTPEPRWLDAFDYAVRCGEEFRAMVAAADEDTRLVFEAAMSYASENQWNVRGLPEGAAFATLTREQCEAFYA